MRNTEQRLFSFLFLFLLFLRLFVAVVVLVLFCCFSVCFVVVLHCRQNRLKKRLLSHSSQPLMGDTPEYRLFFLCALWCGVTPHPSRHPPPLPSSPFPPTSGKKQIPLPCQFVFATESSLFKQISLFSSCEHFALRYFTGASHLHVPSFVSSSWCP